MNKFKNFAITFEKKVNEMAQEIIELGVANKVRLMPDTHIGKGAAIGFTAPVTDKLIPNIIGVDIGCGMTIWKLGKVLPKELSDINDIIKNKVPTGFDPKNHTDKHPTESVKDKLIDFQNNFMNKLTKELMDSFKRYDGGMWYLRQLGSLGSGNHFIEIDSDTAGEHYLVIHSGSRGLGVKVHGYWQEKAIKILKENYKNNVVKRNEIAKTLSPNIPADKVDGIIDDILSKRKPSAKEQEQAYLEGEDIVNYIHDMQIAQEYSIANRREMARIILSNLFEKEFSLVNELEWFDSTHNFIAKDNIIRKGATSAYKNELAIIPINMRDGSIIIKGKGNEDWNFSAPHGAGRLMSRTKAKESISLEDFKETMKDVYSTTVNEQTIDEAPFAYKDFDEIIKAIEPTGTIIKVIKPILNFKGV